MSRRSGNGLENMKTETARELGIDLNAEGNKRLSYVDSGRIGGRMVQKMIEDYRRQNSGRPMQ